MPPRRKPTSTRQKKADQQLKRAIKRGDVVPSTEVKKNPHHRRPKTGPTGQQIGSSDNHEAVESARKLQSAFIKLPPKYLQDTKTLASTLPLLRPIPVERTLFHGFNHDDDADKDVLTCPKRPKWRFDMTKIEVEINEERLFKTWITQTDQLVEEWQNKGELSDVSALAMHRSPSYFERNLEVWRQVWRVTEISQIILVLLDSRCPILHYPPSLASYLAGRQVILVLTKVDIAGSARVEAWTKYIHERYPKSRIVQVESYIEKEARVDHQGRKQYEPSIPEHFRARLVEVIKQVHAELLEPPEKVKNNPNWLKNWVPIVKREIDWEGVLKAGGSKLGSVVGGPAVPRPKSVDEQQEQTDQTDHPNNGQHKEPEYLTIGLIGQPNVGKSSLLNALFGARKVRASKTPGKTKHFQTLYWTPDVRLVDCPGLVMPNYVPMEMQVLAGTLPISRVSAVPSCIYIASQLLPLERIFNLVHPSVKAPPEQDKRTWREGMKPEETTKSTGPLTWTAMDILTAHADAKGWVTAKAGRPDVHRAGNAILRALAEGRIGWAFWPPGTSVEVVAAEGGEAPGIWVPQGDSLDADAESEDDQEEGHDTPSDHSENSGSEEEEEEEEDDVQDGASPKTATFGRFGALAMNEEEEEDDDDDDALDAST
ncbi:hypothetical protein B0H34DRAFT_23959 [Crassisporium funariophilum]|nr:hypothetical protein B0H34DRAFT_23959 [Crassisporium funariophilum]